MVSRNRINSGYRIRETKTINGTYGVEKVSSREKLGRQFLILLAKNLKC